MTRLNSLILLGLIGSLLACSPAGTEVEPAPQRSGEPESFLPPGTIDLDLFPSGIQVTDATSSSAYVTVRWTNTDSTTLTLYRADEDLSWTSVESVVLTPTSHQRVTHIFRGLMPDHAYTVVAHQSDAIYASPTRFRTALDEDATRIVRFGASSCVGRTQKPWPTLSRAAQERFDFFILAGDMVYADNSATEENYRNVWNASLSELGYRDLSASTSLVTTWDDHEVDNNWSWSDPEVSQWVAPARRVYEEVLPWRHGPSATNSIWRSIKWGRTLELFVLDSRGERRDGDYISREQLEWLKRGLSESQARFKVIVNSVPITDFDNWFGEVEADDRWQGYPIQREDILSHIEIEQIEGVFWVSGDFHYTQLGRLALEEDALGGNQWEVLSGPAGSNINPLVTTGLLQANDQFPIILETWTYVAIELNPVTGTAKLEFIDGGGLLIAEYELDL